MAFLFIILLVIATVKANTFCTPGSLLKLKCNTCICSNDGKKALCTDMICPESALSKQVCTPSLQFHDYCNTCNCAEDGLSFVCTRMTCDHNIWNRDGTVKINPKLKEVQKLQIKHVCKPQSQFKYYCNTCICSDDGSSVSCTRMMCDKTIWNKDGTLTQNINISSIDKSAINSQACKPKSIFKESCNLCVCSRDGFSKACTMMTCKKENFEINGLLKLDTQQVDLTSDKVCVPGVSYNIDDCNICICNEDGTRFACTYNLCLSKFKQIYKFGITNQWGRLLKKGDVCTPGKSFYKRLQSMCLYK